MFLVINTSFATSGITGNSFLAMCSGDANFDTCIISYGTMKSGFEYGLIAYPALVLKKPDSSAFFCRDKYSKIKNADEYKDFVKMLSNLDEAILNQDLAYIFVEYLRVKYPLVDCSKK